MPAQLPTNDLRKTKAAFIQAVLARLDSEAEKDTNAPLLTKQEKYAKGLSEWMNSSVRGVLNMSKKRGFAAVVADKSQPNL